jgi:lipase chaperone LimK
MRKKWTKKFKSFNEAEKSDREYYNKMSPEERLDIMQYLREEHFKKNKIRPRLAKTIKIIQQT